MKKTEILLTIVETITFTALAGLVVILLFL